MATWVSWYQTVMQTVLGFPAAEHDGISGAMTTRQPTGAKLQSVFLTKIKTTTRIIGPRFQRTRTRIIVIQKTKTN